MTRFKVDSIYPKKEKLYSRSRLRLLILLATLLPGLYGADQAPLAHQPVGQAFRVVTTYVQPSQASVLMVDVPLATSGNATPIAMTIPEAGAEPAAAGATAAAKPAGSS